MASEVLSFINPATGQEFGQVNMTTPEAVQKSRGRYAAGVS